MISANRLRRRKDKPFAVGDWMMDSGAFTAVAMNGGYTEDVSVYAHEIRKWARCGRLQCAVAQDYMCEAMVLKRTGLDIPTHQRLTIERYDALRQCDTAGIYVLPVLQGYSPEEYQRHVAQYGDRLAPGAWVGVGSVCKRNDSVIAIASVLMAIKRVRPDLRLHGFGLKLTALGSAPVRECLETADSMAWSYSARKQGRNGNDWREAQAFCRRIGELARPIPQMALFEVERGW